MRLAAELGDGAIDKLEVDVGHAGGGGDRDAYGVPMQ